MKRKPGLNTWGKGSWPDFLALWGADGEESHTARKEHPYPVTGSCKIKFSPCLLCTCIKTTTCNSCKEFINLTVILASRKYFTHLLARNSALNKKMFLFYTLSILLAFQTNKMNLAINLQYETYLPQGYDPQAVVSWSLL